ncbi:MAG: hypothetical protein LBQ01_09040 [Prevotellaceae bacterium]|jgi:hypothetical protein|nr:hypothetical protein [Prevotellaceae bacterium]
MKVFSKLLMFALVLSAFTFVGCKDDEKPDEKPPVEENLPIAGVAATYEGNLIVTLPVPGALADTSKNVPCVITYDSSSDSISVSFQANKISALAALPNTFNIEGKCKVTSDKEKYSFSSSVKNLTIPSVGDVIVYILNTSSIDKDGNAVINMPVVLAMQQPETPTTPEETQTAIVRDSYLTVPDGAITVKFEGKKK